MAYFKGYLTAPKLKFMAGYLGNIIKAAGAVIGPKTRILTTGGARSLTTGADRDVT